MSLLRQVVALKSHVFWEDDIAIHDAAVSTSLLVGHRQVTDVWLLGLAVHRAGRLVTLDGDLLSLLPQGSPRVGALCIVDVIEPLEKGDA